MKPFRMLIIVEVAKVKNPTRVSLFLKFHALIDVVVVNILGTSVRKKGITKSYLASRFSCSFLLNKRLTLELLQLSSFHLPGRFP